jgi:hypothetical protein
MLWDEMGLGERMKRTLDRIRLIQLFPKGNYKKYNSHLGAAHELVGKKELMVRHDIRKRPASTVLRLG